MENVSIDAEAKVVKTNLLERKCIPEDVRVATRFVSGDVWRLCCGPLFSNTVAHYISKEQSMGSLKRRVKIARTAAEKIKQELMTISTVDNKARYL